MADSIPTSSGPGEAIEPLRESIIRYVVLGVGMIAVSIIMSLAVGPLQSPRGVAGPTVGLAAQPILAGTILLATLACSMFICVLVGKAINAVVGMFVLGWGLVVLSMQCGTIADVVFDGSGVMPLVFEGIVWGVVVLILSALMFRLCGALPDIPVDDPAESTRPSVIFSGDALKSAAAGLLLLVVVWLLLSNNLKGQAIAAATIGGVLTGLGGRLLSPRVQPVLLFAVPVFVGVLGYAIAMSMMQSPPDEMFVTSTLPKWAKVMPLDLAGGALVGVSMGIGWARGMLE